MAACANCGDSVGDSYFGKVSVVGGYEYYCRKGACVTALGNRVLPGGRG